MFFTVLARARSLAFCALAGAALLGLAACSGNLEPSDKDIRRAETLRPKAAALAERYERSCITCHARPGTGAPLSGHAAAWKKPLQKGMPQLLQSAKQGINAMPAMGMCQDCSDAELEQLIRFMAGQE
ncbi:c-type cytochrome [Massilia sp. W12]|uniref:c-type cytochrome n=1 Tax=Massilia sp. W12 TaxID=3126507 RepID=UPI0030D0D97C